MKVAVNTTRLIGPPITREQFIPAHLFFYLVEGGMRGHYGDKDYALEAGEYGVIRKNRLGRQTHVTNNGYAEKVIFVFDEPYLRSFQEKHRFDSIPFYSVESFVQLPPNNLIPAFIESLKPYYNEKGQIDQAFFDVKRDELLLILLHLQPELSGVFFEYSIPQKINLEEFMLCNFKYNVSLERFAFMSGRSLSAFKRDFEGIFHQTPSRWLVKKRLQEAYFLIETDKKRASEIYLDLGFETLSHFSVAFKKMYGLAPTRLMQ